jgi:hypothetical protein
VRISFAFNNKNNISELRIVYYLAHVSYQRIDRLVVDFIFFKFSNVEDTNVIKPLAPIKASKYKELLCSNNASSMALSSSWGFLKILRDDSNA